MQKIGSITIDDTYYPGKDLYSDGEIEDEMLDIAKNVPVSEYNRVIAERKSWAILYHFSNVRENIVQSMPITKEDSVLEIGAGCGAITGVLARMAKNVDAVELSMKRSLINAYRHQEADNITIKVGNFQEVEQHLEKKYDVITLIGVFEYACSYIDSDCLLYTSDAADEEDSVDLGGARILKKKKEKKREKKREREMDRKEDGR